MANISGLELDLYYSDNPIIVDFNNLSSDIKYIEISVNNPIIAFTEPIRLYTDNLPRIRYNISTLIKSQFQDYPINTDYETLTPFEIPNNYRNINLTFTFFGNTTSTQIINKTFVRGGVREQGTNKHTQNNFILSPTDRLPQFGTYPVAYYFFNPSKKLIKHNVLPDFKREELKVKGCDPIYFKFKNSLGGYSYWLFEDFIESRSNTNLPYIQTNEGFDDLGNYEDISLEVISKVPKRYFPLIQDLVISNEVYIYKDLEWEQVKNSKNNIKQNLSNQTEKVKLKFDRILNYNPSELW